MATGGSTWQTATPIEPSTTSDPTALDGLTAGTYRPYFSAWWKITPSAPLGLRLSTAETAALGSDPTGYADTIITVYTEAQILDAGGDPDAANFNIYNDDFDGLNGRSQVDAELDADTTYYIRVGAHDSNGSNVAAYVLTATQWVWSAWVQPDNRVASGGYWSYAVPVNETRTAQASRSTSPVPDNSTLSESVFAGYNATTQNSFSGSGALRLGTGLEVTANTNLDRNVWTYPTSAGTREIGGAAVLPDLDGSPPPESEWPAGAFYVEADTADSTEVLSLGISYTFTEGSYDQSGGGSGGAAFEQALGSWDYTFSTEVDSVTITGPLAYGAQATGLLAATSYVDGYGYQVADAWASLALYGVQARDPGFGKADDGVGGGTYRIGSCTWQFTTQVTYRPPRVRYKILGGSPPPTTRRYLRPQRHSQRGDGFNMSSAPRHVQGRTRQSTLRNFGIR